MINIQSGGSKILLAGWYVSLFYVCAVLTEILWTPAWADEPDILEPSPPNTGSPVSSLKSGKVEFADGSKYEGGLELGKMHGTGVFHYANGDIYEGEFSQGIMGQANPAMSIQNNSEE